MVCQGMLTITSKYNSTVQLDLKNGDPSYLDNFEKLRYILYDAFKIDAVIFCTICNMNFHLLGKLGHR